MMALSVRQPWAWGILHGKPVENRTWTPASPDRRRVVARAPFRVLLHASATCTRAAYAEAVEFIEVIADLKVSPLAELPRGAIVGAMTVTGWVDEHESAWFVGPGALTLADAVALPEPIPCKGALGFFTVAPQVAEAVRQAAAARSGA